jgi:uncharacterized protein YhfF
VDGPGEANDLSELAIAEFAFPGPLRDRLVEAIVSGRKTTTTGLAMAYQVEHEPLPEPGQRFLVVDSSNEPVATIEVTSVRVVALGDVDLSHVRDEGEGDETMDTWRRTHEAFWRSEDMTAVLGDPTFAVDDTTLVVLERFRLISRRD